MKTIIRTITALILIGLSLASCTDVIEVDTPEIDSRLVIEASIDWEKGTLGNSQTIILSKSSSYFDQQLIPVTDASVKITKNDDGLVFIFEDQSNGEYSTNDFIPELNQSYTLEIIYNDQHYTATEILKPVVDIQNVYQSMDKGLGDLLEFNVDFQDPLDEENYYFFKFKEQEDFLPTFFNIRDEFVNGNLVNIFYEREEDEDINQVEYTQGDVVEMQLHGISKNYYDYMRILINQYESINNPFGAVPVPLIGNCINETVPDNDAFGYFRLTEMVKRTYTFQ